MNGYSHIVIVGNLGGEPEVRYLPDGKALTKFSIAVNDGYGEKKHVSWFSVSVFGGMAEACAKYLKKGSRVLVEGTMRQSHIEKDGSTVHYWGVIASRVVFLDKKSDGSGNNDSRADSMVAEAIALGGVEVETDDGDAW